MKQSYLFLAAMLCVVFTACEVKETPDDSNKAKYTVILYGNGGENLDSEIEEDIYKAAEFLNSKDKDYSVRMVTCMKYSSEKGLAKQKYTPGGKAGEVYCYELGYTCYKDADKSQTQYLALPDEWIIDHSDAKMYEPAYIAQVMKLIARDAPAENYILVVAGHAGGWQIQGDGEYPDVQKKPAVAMIDAFNKNAGIKAKDLAEGIRQAGMNISTIVFDCCMMNNIEYLSELTDVPNLKYTIGSGHTTHGGDYSDLLRELYKVTGGQQDIVKALGNYAEVYAENHKEDYQNYDDIILMNVDFAVVDLAKLKETWAPIKNITDYLCANYKASDSALYEQPSRYCYQYYNRACKYDLIDYLTLMRSNGAPYAKDAQYETLLSAVSTAMDNCILHHAYSLNYAEDVIKPKENASTFIRMSINIGAKGRMQYDFEGEEERNYICYDNEGNPWYFNNEGITWTRATDLDNIPNFNWAYSYALSTFEAKTGWTRWLKLNPVLPFNNPPVGDDGDSDQ